MATTTAMRKPPTDTGRCGSPAGYQRHRRRDEEPCEPCATARREDDSSARVERREALLAALDTRDAKPLSSYAVFGRFAGLNTLHRMRPMAGGGQCLECFGFPDDPRHPVTELAAA